MAHNHGNSSHFKGKDAIGHVIEAQAEGLVSSSEIHGTEMPGYFSAVADAARDTAALLAISWVVLDYAGRNEPWILGIVGGSWAFWKGGRSAWLGWFRLERLHRILAQEKWEIEHHRHQERDELRELYAAKGFEGKLLEEVLDVLMADGDRLLRVMVEEELGLRLEAYEHPLKQGFGAILGAFLATLIIVGGYVAVGSIGLIVAVCALIGISGGASALRSQNSVVDAAIWNLGIFAFSFGFAYFFLKFFA